MFVVYAKSEQFAVLPLNLGNEHRLYPALSEWLSVSAPSAVSLKSAMYPTESKNIAVALPYGSNPEIPCSVNRPISSTTSFQSSLVWS